MKCGTRRRIFHEVAYLRFRPVVYTLLCSGPPLFSRALTSPFDLVPRCQVSRFQRPRLWLHLYTTVVIWSLSAFLKGRNLYSIIRK